MLNAIVALGKVIMVEKIPFDDDHILGLRVSGKIEQAAFVQIMQELIPRVESSSLFRLYIEIPKYEGFDWELIWESLKFASQEFRNYFKKVDKIAFVTDKAWLRFLASAEYTLIPGIKEKSFRIEEREKALEWIAE